MAVSGSYCNPDCPGHDEEPHARTHALQRRKEAHDHRVQGAFVPVPVVSVHAWKRQVIG